MLDLLWRTCFRWALHPHHVTGDGKYGTVENIAAVEEAGIRAYISVCAACSLKPECTTNKDGRSIRRGPGDEYIDKVKSYMQTKP